MHMTEAANVEATPEAKAETPELTETEIKASEQGWVPKDEWVEAGGDPSEWRSAREFVDRGELLKTIHNTRRDLKQTQNAMSALQRHHQYVYEKAHRQAIEDLKMQKRQAMREEDFDRAEAIEEQIEEITTTHQQEAQALQQEQAAVSAQPPAEFVAWKERNTWYDGDLDMQEFADAAGIAYAKRNPKAEPSVVLKHVEERVRRAYPEKFGPQRKAAPSPTASVDRTPRRTTKSDDIELDDNERSIMNDLVRNKVMTEAEYKAEIKKMKGK